MMMPSLTGSYKGIITASSTSVVSGNATDLLAGFRDTSNHGLLGGVNQDVIVRANNNYSVMDSRPTAVKDGDFFVDIILPTILIALLFAGNAVIVYIIFQYRKRPVVDNFRKTPGEIRGEEVALSIGHNGDTRV